MNIEEGDIGAAIQRNAALLGYAHVADSNRGALGGGHFDIKGYFCALADAGYTATSRWRASRPRCSRRRSWAACGCGARPGPTRCRRRGPRWKRCAAPGPRPASRSRPGRATGSGLGAWREAAARVSAGNSFRSSMHCIELPEVLEEESRVAGGKEVKQGILARIRWRSAYMNPALRRIADRVLRAPEEVKSISIKDLAAQCEVSESTVTRFVREIEVPSFQQFKILIAEELSQGGSPRLAAVDRHVYEDITDDDDTASVMSKVAARYAMTVEDTRAGLSADRVARPPRRSNRRTSWRSSPWARRFSASRAQSCVSCGWASAAVLPRSRNPADLDLDARARSRWRSGSRTRGGRSPPWTPCARRRRRVQRRWPSPLSRIRPSSATPTSACSRPRSPGVVDGRSIMNRWSRRLPSSR